MSADSKIAWTHHTFNPWWGCVKVSPGCDHCYAEPEAERYGHRGLWGADATRWVMSDAYWSAPLKWNRKAEAAGERRRVFCGSHCDVMEEGEYLQRVRERLYPLIEATPWLTWCLLTKRPQNFRRFLPAAWLHNPRPNVMGMTTVESEVYCWRLVELMKTPFAWRSVSLEPLLAQVDISWWLPPVIPAPLSPERYLDWVIVGGESGPKARPMESRWVQSLRDQCQAAGVPFFFKQWGDWLGPDQDGANIDGHQILNASNVPERVGKKAAGALLDGREWKQVLAALEGVR